MNGKERQDEVKAIRVAAQKDEIVVVAQGRKWALARGAHGRSPFRVLSIRVKASSRWLQAACNKRYETNLVRLLCQGHPSRPSGKPPRTIGFCHLATSLKKSGTLTVAYHRKGFRDSPLRLSQRGTKAGRKSPLFAGPGGTALRLGNFHDHADLPR